MTIPVLEVAAAQGKGTIPAQPLLAETSCHRFEMGWARTGAAAAGGAESGVAAAASAYSSCSTAGAGGGRTGGGGTLGCTWGRLTKAMAQLTAGANARCCFGEGPRWLHPLDCLPLTPGYAQVEQLFTDSSSWSGIPCQPEPFQIPHTAFGWLTHLSPHHFERP